MSTTAKTTLHRSTGLLILATALSSLSYAQPTPQPGAPTARQNIQSSQATQTAQKPQQSPSAEVEKQRQQTEQDAAKTLDQDAIAAINETQIAVKAIADGKTDVAIAAIERAIGKINVAVARDPAVALLPVDLKVEVIDLAPFDIDAINKIVKASRDAVENQDYPEARILLDQLTNEIRVRTSHLPLATYPIVLADAARLLSQKKTDEAKVALSTALRTLVIIDRVTPLPLSVAQFAVQKAEDVAKQNKDQALKLVETAKNELARAQALGYAGKDPEYVALNDAVSDLEQKLTGNQDAGSAFARLKQKIASFFHRQSTTSKPSEQAGQQGPRISRAGR